MLDPESWATVIPALTSPQTFTVTPDDALWEPTNSTRSYTVDVGDADEVQPAVAEAGNVSIDNGVVTFEAEDDDADELVADFGDPDAGFTSGHEPILFVAGGAGGDLTLLRRETGQVSDIPVTVDRFAVSPDGHRLASVSSRGGGELRIVDPGGVAEIIPMQLAPVPAQPTWAPSSAGFAFIASTRDAERGIYLVDTVEGEVVSVSDIDPPLDAGRFRGDQQWGMGS